MVRLNDKLFWMRCIFLMVECLDGKACEDADEIIIPGTYSLSGDQPLPSSVSLNISDDNFSMNLFLERNNDPHHDLPLQELSRDHAGTYHVTKLKVNYSAEFAMYSDTRHSASFLLQFEKKKTRNTRLLLSMEGIVLLHEKLLHLSKIVPFEKGASNVVQDASNKGFKSIFKGVFLLKIWRHTSSSQDNASSEGAFIAVPIPNLRPHYIKKAPKPLRHKRQVISDIHIDVTAIIDFSLYSRWYNMSTSTIAMDKRTETIQKINVFYALVFNGIDMIYKSITSLPYKINVHLKSIIVSVNANTSSWTEEIRKSAFPKDEIDGRLALEKFSAWARTTKDDMDYDHLMLFTGYEMISYLGSIRSWGATGIGYLGMLCDRKGWATSVIEDAGGFSCIRVAAHELGHSVSANHDGVGNNCDGGDGFVMASNYMRITEEKRQNYWRFSTCSIDSFNRFLTDKVKTSAGQACLYNVTFGANPPPDVKSVMPGQLYTANEQCRLRFGPTSYVCQGPGGTSVNGMCFRMQCHNPLNTQACHKITPATGTTCGNKKWCINSECVFDSAAPEIGEECILGDDPFIKYFNKPCREHVSNFSGHCYDEGVRKSCCQSCAAFYTGVPGCEYGDKNTGCVEYYCSQQGEAYLKECCRTCKSLPTTNPILTTTPPPRSVYRTTTSNYSVTTPIFIMTTPNESGAEIQNHCTFNNTFLLSISMVILHFFFTEQGRQFLK